MIGSFDSPLVVFAVSLIVQWLSAYIGDHLRKKSRPLSDDQRDDLEILQTASLTLLALIIGFSFSMAVTRYDQRKNYEEAEANAIGTEYLRISLLPGDNPSRAREALRKYLDLRIAFYESRDESRLSEIGGNTAKLQNELWSTVQNAANVQPTPIVGLAVAGMNDVLNAQGFTQAAWWNRIPAGAWAMMGLIAIACNALLGFRERRKRELLLWVLPIIISISFFLIADIDSPRAGIIHVLPRNLIALSQSISAPSEEFGPVPH